MSAANASLVGRRVRLSISEPWEFESEFGTGSLSGRIGELRSDPAPGLVVELDDPITFADEHIAALTATARYEGESVLDLVGRGEVVSTFVPTDARGVRATQSRRFTHLVGVIHAES
jgi:hypothetical protein